MHEEGNVTNAYCTYFDIGYAPRGLAMMTSLRAVGETGPVYAICFDAAAVEVVQQASIPGVRAVPIEDVEAQFPDLPATKAERGRVEYYFTSTPTVVTYAMWAEPDAEWVTYLDADLWFFASPADVYGEQAPGSVGIIEHGYSARQQWRTKFGVYNVGWVSFRSNDSGRACLAWWRDRCIEWCFDRTEGGRFADQGYLNEFRAVCDDVVVIQHPGANLAPWNLEVREVACRDGAVSVDGRPLVFFHFHALQRWKSRWYLPHARYRARTTACLRSAVYGPYLRSLERFEATVGASARPRRRGTLIGSVKQFAVRAYARVRGDSVQAGGMTEK